MSPGETALTVLLSALDAEFIEVTNHIGGRLALLPGKLAIVTDAIGMFVTKVVTADLHQALCGNGLRSETIDLRLVREQGSSTHPGFLSAVNITFPTHPEEVFTVRYDAFLKLVETTMAQE